LGEPRFVQGIGMFCDRCNGAGWQSYEQTYVDMLTKQQKQKLNAVIVGSVDGIDMDVVVQMRMGTSASSLEKTSRSILIRRHCVPLVIYVDRDCCSGKKGQRVEREDVLRHVKEARCNAYNAAHFSSDQLRAPTVSKIHHSYFKVHYNSVKRRYICC
jgi:hypothetical protein